MLKLDLADLEQTDTADIQLVHPVTGEDLDAVIEVYGQDTDVYRAASRKNDDLYAKYARKNKGELMPAESRERLDRSKVVACTKEIKGNLFKGMEAEEVYTKYPWAYEQTIMGILDRGNFMKGSSAK